MFTVEEIINITQGKILQGGTSIRVRRVSTDSRDIKKRDLFIAIKGDSFDAHNFVNDVVRLGASVLLVQKHVRLKNKDVAVVLVKDTVLAMGALAKAYRMRFSIPVIALTGSAGKTTTKEMLARVLKTSFRVLYNIKSFNNHIGVPLTLFQLNSRHEIVVLECGTNQPGDIAYLADIVRPTAVIFTNIGESHLERLKTLDGVLKEKWHLADHLKRSEAIVYNADDERLFKLIGKRGTGVSLSKPVEWRARNIEVTKSGKTQFLLGAHQIRLNSAGLHQGLNALLVAAMAAHFKVPVAKIIKALNIFQFPSGRGQLIKIGKLTIIDDTYNANPVSVRGAVDLLTALKAFNRRVLIIGDMLELGVKAKRLHQEIGKYIEHRAIERVITVGQLTESIMHVLKNSKRIEVTHFENVDDLIKDLKNILKSDDVILIKGSRRMKMERILDSLQ